MYCFQLTHVGDHYDGVREDVPGATVTSTYKILEFGRFSVKIHRTDISGDTVDLTGGIASDNAGVVGGQLVYHGHTGNTVYGKFTLTWDPTGGLATQDKSPLTAQDIATMVKQADLFYATEHSFDAAFPLYDKAARAGNIHAQSRLGFYYFAGRHEPKDCTEALRRFHLGDDSGDPAGTYDLARAYDNGWCVKEDDAAAYRLYEKAVAKGSIDAAIMIVGNKTMTNPAEAARMMARGAEQGEPLAMMTLANLYAAGTQIRKNIPAAKKLFEAAAEEGNSAAMGSLGNLYETGADGPIDIEAAYQWYSRQEEFGDTEGALAKRDVVEAGYDVNNPGAWKSPSNGTYLNLKGLWQAYFEQRFHATTLQIAQADNHLVAYKVEINAPSTHLGYFMRVDYNPVTFTGKAQRYQGSDLGKLPPLSQAQWGPPEDFILIDPDHFELEGKIFQRSSGLNPHDVPCDESNRFGVQPAWATQRAQIDQQWSDDTTAACWYHAAAVGGSARSMSEYGNFLHQGLGVRRNDPEALQWLEKGADSGDYYGAQILSTMYEKGDGVAADPAKAQMWRTKSQQLKAAMDRVLEAQKRQEQAQERDMEFFHSFMTGALNLFMNEMARDPACDDVQMLTSTEDAYRDSMRKKKTHDEAVASGKCKPTNIDVNNMVDVSGKQ